MMKSYKFLESVSLSPQWWILKVGKIAAMQSWIPSIIHRTDSAVLYIDPGELLTIWFIQI